MQDKEFESFRLSTGGLISRLFHLSRIQKPGAYSIHRRLILIIVLCWLPLVLLTAIEGNFYNTHIELPFIYDIQPYVRYLLILPFLIVAGTIIDPLIRYVIQSIGTSGILGDSNKVKFYETIEKLAQRKDSYAADIVIIIISYTIVLSFLANLEKFDASSEYTNWIVIKSESGVGLTLAGWWFILVSSPALQIILFRWFWRFYLWSHFLFQLSRIKLDLQPAHPDLAGGLGILKNSENAFIMIYFALGSMLSVSLAVDIIYTDVTLEQVLPIIISYIIVAIIVMTIPLFFFSHQLASTRRWGLVIYGDLGYRLSRAFQNKWGDPSDQTNGDELLKTADSSVVCDYSDIYTTVKEMRFIPISVKGLLTQSCALIIPFLPLVFTEQSLPYIIRRILESLI